MLCEVRCCCEPGKLLGYVQLPEEPAVGTRKRLVLRPQLLPAWEVPTITGAHPMAGPTIEYLELPYEKLALNGWLILRAFKSNDTPLETLRRLQGWHERFDAPT